MALLTSQLTDVQAKVLGAVANRPGTLIWMGLLMIVLGTIGIMAETLSSIASSSLVGGFALRLDSNRKLLDQLANIGWNRLPLNYLDTWTDDVQRVTVADIQAAFRRVLQPDRMVTVIVGGQP